MTAVLETASRALVEAPEDAAVAAGSALTAALGDARLALRPAQDAPLQPLSEAELLEAFDVAGDLVREATAARSQLLAELISRGVPAHSGAASAAMWLRQRERISAAAANREVKVAELAASESGQRLRQALNEGSLNLEQAGAIATQVAHAPDTATAETKAQAVQELLGYAPQLDPAGLTAMGITVWAKLDTAASAEERRLARERRARERRELVFNTDGDGAVVIRGSLPELDAAFLRTALDPLATPRPSAEDGPDPRTGAQRYADALVELARRASKCKQLPDNGGVLPQLVVTIEHRVLRDATGAAMLGDGTAVSVGEARRIACDAQVLPVVLGSDSVPLDVGRSQRLFPRPLRVALALRDGGCAFPGCDRPSTWCDAHHIRPWWDGGETSIPNGVLLCGHHHRLIHQGEWTVHMAADGHPQFVPPSTVEPQRTPRRNHTHHRWRN